MTTKNLFGSFSGTVKAEWLDEGRKMKLLEPLTYTDPSGIEWLAPLHSVVDGASIPKFAWSIIGGPFEGKYRKASVIHDVACDQKTRSWESVHEAFLNAMLASDVETILAHVMYGAVYHFGPRWNLQILLKKIPRLDIETKVTKIQSKLDLDSQVSFDIQPKSESTETEPSNSTELVDIPIHITAPAKWLQESDFQKLEAAIRENNLSLAEIRNYRPQHP
jgi:Protein of unknown function (DUF1353)